MSAQVIELPTVREGRRRASILAEAAAFWGVDVAAVSLASGPDVCGRWWAVVTGPGNRTLATGDHPTRELAEEAARPRFVVARALLDLPPHLALEAIERALVALGVQLPSAVHRRALLHVAHVARGVADDVTPRTEGTTP